MLEYARAREDFLAAVRAGIAEGKNRGELEDTIKMQQHSHFPNDRRMRGRVYALHHLPATGKPVASFS